MSVRTLPVVVSCSCGCREQGRSRRLRFGQAGGVVGVKGPGALLPGNTPPQVGNKEGTEGSRKLTSRVPYIRTHKETRVSPGSLCFAVLIPGDISSPPPHTGAPAPARPCLFPATSRRLLLMLGPLPQRGRVYSRRRLVASSSCWGPCPSEAVFIPGDVSSPPPHAGAPAPARPCLFPATSRRLLLMLGPLPQRGRVYSRRRLVASSSCWGPCPSEAVFIPGDVSSPPPHAGAPAPARPCLFPATSRRLLLMLGPLPQRGRVYSRRRLVASSSCWGPCPSEAVFIPGDVCMPGDVSSSPPHRGVPAPRRPC